MNRVAVVLLLAFSTAALAQYQNPLGKPGEPGYSAPGKPNSEPGKLNEPGRSFGAEVVDIDKVSGTVTLKHGPIDMLGVRPGTVEYNVKDASKLKAIKVGERVRFNAVLQGRSLLVTDIAPAN
jgi:Cu(I)/Ag(I) efflux system protein CusF